MGVNNIAVFCCKLRIFLTDMTATHLSLVSLLAIIPIPMVDIVLFSDYISSHGAVDPVCPS